MNSKNNETLVCALGGLGEVGKNMYVVMHEEELFVIDCGVMFPEDDLMGIDYVLADYSILKNMQDKIKGLIITHGHEDHIGGIPFLLQHINIPIIYAPRVAEKLIKNKLSEKNIPQPRFININEELNIKTKHFNIDFFRTTHSIPDSYGMAIRTVNGTIVETGDFKFDFTPIGPVANLGKMAAVGNEGATLLLSDSTNALIPGFSNSESVVDETLGEIFAANTESRIILATFASNIYRLTHIIETCKENNRKVATFGRSMNNSIEIASEFGLIKDKDIFITSDEANRLEPSKVCLLCTGSQGEPLAALSRIANGNDRNITLMPNDTVIFSSSPIPGNAMSINRIINKLYLKGAKVYTNASESNIHTSGHARQDELKLLLRLIKPKYFMPMHGEYRMLKAHADLAVQCDVPEENTFINKNGDILALKDGEVYRKGSIPINDIYVDGSRIGDVGVTIIKDRKIMSTDGVLIVILNLDVENRKMLIEPNIITRGFVVVNDNQELIKQIQDKTNIITMNELEKDNFNLTDLKNRIILEINSYVIELTGRRPIIIPMILNVNKKEDE
ncbi:MAG: ribonuclease J [Bacilli bacterium]|nr:ribonuclease J [Bacilli bacterium]